MAARKNWFVYLSLILFIIGTAYALFSGVRDLPGITQDPYLRYGGALVIFALLLLLVYGISKIHAKRHLWDRLPIDPDRSRRVERIAVAVIIATSAALRIFVIAKMPITPSSDFETYYRIAELMTQGGLRASGYGGYIAQFPHVIGYPFVLSLLFRVTGPSVLAGLYLNMAASLFSVFLVYRIARTLAGRLGGFIALIGAAFWPSQILYGTILASEPVFTCLLLLGLWLFIYLFRYPQRISTLEGAIFLCITLGAMLALTNAIRPLSTVMLIAAILCFIPCVVRFNRNEKLLNSRLTRAACQGWFRAGIIFITFTACTQLIGASISNTIAYKLPGGAASFGYNLMVGVNVDSKGTWNQEDADFFAEQFNETNSATEAHRASLEVALARIRNNPEGIAILAVEKFAALWDNDDYGDYWTTLFLSQQGHLTPERQSFIDSFKTPNNILYLTAVFFSMVFAVQLLLSKKTSPAQGMILLFIGTAALHMLLEFQNRYHYFMLPIFIIFAATAIANILHGHEDKSYVQLTFSE